MCNVSRAREGFWWKRYAFCWIALAVGASNLRAQEPRADLPSAAQVLARYVAALGGEAVVLRPQAATTWSQVNIRPGVTLEQVDYRSHYRSLNVTTLPNGATVRSGFDGEHGWQIGPSGVRLLDQPMGSLRRDADIAYAAHVLESFATMATVGIEAFEGRPCYHLQGTTKWGEVNNQYYDSTTGLLAGYRFRGRGDSTLVTMVFSDWRSFGAAPVATRIVRRQGDKILTITVTNESYEPIAPEMLAPPDTIRALLRQQR